MSDRISKKSDESKSKSEILRNLSESERLRVSELLTSFNSLEEVFKNANLALLKLDTNVLNEYRYFARALVEIFQDCGKFDDAYGKAHTAYSAALCDTIDNIHLYVESSLKTIQAAHPNFRLIDFLKSIQLDDSLKFLSSTQNIISSSRKQRTQRPDLYLSFAETGDFKELVKFSLALPRIMAAAPSGTKEIGWLEKIFDGLEKKEFSLYFQPKKNIENENIFGAEALLRWHHGDSHVSISPAVFIPKAEESGAIHALGEFVISEAVNTLVKWGNSEKFKDIVLSINVSASQFDDIDFTSRLAELLRKNNIPQEKLQLELTEDVLVKDKGAVKRQLRSIPRCGLAVDDFGKGSTEFLYLADFNVNTVKIDRELYLRAIDGDGKERCQLLLKGINSLSQQMNADVVVEGVESQDGIDLLRGIGISSYQGYYKDGKPKSLEDFETYFNSKTKQPLHS